jgi:hypothetical protein
MISLEPNFMELIRVKNVRPEHAFLDLLPLLWRQIRIQNYQFSRIDDNSHLVPGLVEHPSGDRSPNLVIVSECREKTGFENVHGDNRVFRVNWLSLGQRCA